MTVSVRGSRSGSTLVEVSIASAVLLLLALTLFKGVQLAARLAQDNAEYLAADAYAFDLAVKRSRELSTELLKVRYSTNGAVTRETIVSNACPPLYRAGTGNAAESLTRITWAKDKTGANDQSALAISVDVEWGPRGQRKLLSDRFAAATVVKTSLSE